MNAQNSSNQQTDLDRILEKINEIVEKSADGDYIYRGEAEYFEKIASSLYREYPHAEGEGSDIERDQAAILDEVKEYTSESDPIKILTELQHFGGKTNLIDFTKDYLIALFFACDGSHEKPGRVILQKRESEHYKIEEAPKAIKRAEHQKSVFVQSPDGFIEPDIEVDIPVDLKFPMLEYLRKYHRISAESIYNDLHGFITTNGRFFSVSWCVLFVCLASIAYK
ncbi:MAG: FRG domain-containing protein, partial [Candidatus Poribacteria bacterium]|nr:FRG domain-containing protein [Candidatus Poribacteria bacterium]